ncbi:ubiquitin-conjugating enzyme E2 S-like [Stylophora pistillata]|uniref:E2 ubiquitin-conjugating enzyme n=1 Tax=Stylophora pistillata TaxID=50429 RepID=A0A2B4STP0_STYPI|nr:ubiquitin-conjugating enzyme E2 S-like [Stylophora pistillata]PFX31857.1 Ubiquitin-conjugating enzyme E2 S [Stylophora pistillata]
MASTSSNVENLHPQILKQVMKELRSLSCDPPEGIKILSNDEDITDIQATIEGPAGTPYEGGLFRVKLVLGKDFPASPPKGFFSTKIFHPNVASNGEICVNTLKKDWKPDLGVKHILLTIKCLLIVPNPESALNEEAGKLLLERYDDYSKRAQWWTDIHAKTNHSNKMESMEKGETFEATQGIKRASDKALDKKKKDKKRALKRL